MLCFYYRWSQQYGGEALGGSFRSSRMSQQKYAGSNQVAGLLVAASKSLHAPSTTHHHPFFSMQHANAGANASSCLGGLLAPRNSLGAVPSLGVASLLSPQQFLAKRPSLQEAPSEVILLFQN